MVILGVLCSYYRLKDPYSAHYKFFEPYKGYSWVMNVPADKEQLMFGWIIPVSVNAKMDLVLMLARLNL